MLDFKDFHLIVNRIIGPLFDAACKKQMQCSSASIWETTKARIFLGSPIFKKVKDDLLWSLLRSLRKEANIRGVGRKHVTISEDMKQQSRYATFKEQRWALGGDIGTG